MALVLVLLGVVTREILTYLTQPSPAMPTPTSNTRAFGEGFVNFPPFAAQPQPRSGYYGQDSLGRSIPKERWS